jgi:hypothetical protein
VYIPPAGRRDAAAEPPPAKTDASRADRGSDPEPPADDEGTYTQAVASSSCALVPARTPGSFGFGAAGLLLAGAAALRRGQRRRARGR